jgi:hypothetical protein
MVATALCIETLSGTQDRQKGQCSDTVGPGERRQQHTHEPAQTTGFDKMRMGGTHGITVDAFGGDLLAASALKGVVQAQGYGTPRDAYRHSARLYPIWVTEKVMAGCVR